MLKISTPKLQEEGAQRNLVASVVEAIHNASLGPLPGELIVAIVALFYAALAFVALAAGQEEGELAIGDVHV